MKKLLVLLLVAFAVVGCSRHSVAPIVEPVHLHDTLHIYHNDTIRDVDSTIIERETIIREADSSLLAAYGVLGIQLKENEKAFLVLRQSIEQRIKELEEKKIDTVYSKIEVPVPTPVIQEVEKPLPWWKESLMRLGGLVLLIGLVYVAVKVFRWWKQRKI